MASSLSSSACALPLQLRVATAAAAGPSCRMLFAVTPPLSASSMRRARLLAPPLCSALEDPAAGSEQGRKEKGGATKRVRGRPVWRRILFASKKPQHHDPQRPHRHIRLEELTFYTSYGGKCKTQDVGDMLSFFSAVFFGIHMLRTEQISRSTDKKKFMALLSFEVLVVAFSSIIWFLFKDSFVDVHDSNFESWTFGMLLDSATSFPWIPALYTGVFSTGLCLWAEMVAMANVSATESAIVYGLEPVWGAAFAWFLLGERWDNAAWIGAALVLCGSLTVQLFGSAPEKPKKVQPRSTNALETPLKRQNHLSLSPIHVDFRKNIGSQLGRKDKTL